MGAFADEISQSLDFAPGEPIEHAYGDKHPAIQAKLAELQSRTIEYNRELIRITGELTEIRERLSRSQQTRGRF